MNEQPTQEPIEQQPYTSQPAPKHSRTIRQTVGIVLLCVLALAGIGYSAYAWQQNQSLSSDVKSKDSRIASLQSSLAGANNQPETTVDTKPAMVTAALPNGKKISYELSEQNAQIMWWTDSASNDSNFVSVSDKRIFTFLHTIEPTVLKSACSIDDITGSDISLGVFDLVGKKYMNNQYADCLAILAGDAAGVSAATKAQATQLRTSAVENVKNFISSSVIQ